MTFFETQLRMKDSRFMAERLHDIGKYSKFRNCPNICEQSQQKKW